MDFVTELLQQYGYPILFALGLVEFLGAPVASGAVLMVVGAFAVQGVLAGGLFQEEVRAIVEWASSRATWIISALVALFVVALVWRVIKTKRHRVFHAAHVRD